jgi:hypothetical protein
LWYLKGGRILIQRGRDNVGKREGRGRRRGGWGEVWRIIIKGKDVYMSYKMGEE